MNSIESFPGFPSSIVEFSKSLSERDVFFDSDSFLSTLWKELRNILVVKKSPVLVSEFVKYLGSFGNVTEFDSIEKSNALFYLVNKCSELQQILCTCFEEFIENYDMKINFIDINAIDLCLSRLLLLSESLNCGLKLQQKIYSAFSKAFRSLYSDLALTEIVLLYRRLITETVYKKGVLKRGFICLIVDDPGKLIRLHAKSLLSRILEYGSRFLKEEIWYLSIIITCQNSNEFILAAKMLMKDLNNFKNECSKMSCYYLFRLNSLVATILELKFSQAEIDLHCKNFYTLKLTDKPPIVLPFEHVKIVSEFCK